MKTAQQTDNEHSISPEPADPRLTADDVWVTNEKELIALLEINNSLLKLDDPEARRRVLDYHVAKFCPYHSEAF